MVPGSRLLQHASYEDKGLIMDLLQITGKAAMRLAGLHSQTIDDTYETLECFNAVQAQRGECVATVGAVGSLTYTGEYEVDGELQIGLNVDFAANDELEIIPYVNGVAYADNPLMIRGMGVAKPVAMFWISQMTFAPGDVITLMAKNAIAGALSINFTRTLFCMKIDG